MISKSKIIGAVEIGTSKVVVLIGEIADGRSLNIIGMGQCSSQGVVKGAVVDFKAASDCTHAAILAAEDRAGARVEGVYLAQTGGHLEGFYNEAAVNVTAADNLVGADDIETVCALAKAKELPPERTVIHHVRHAFRLDGRPVQNPDCLEGRKLEVGYWTVHGEANKVSDNIHIINGFSLRVLDIILASLATGAMVATSEDRNHGALVIDIGSGTTDFVLYRDGHVQCTGVIPVGGDHVTNDLSLGLRLTSGQAETLKQRHARATVQAKDKSEKVWLNGDLAVGDRQIPLQSIEQIAAARAGEIFEVVRKRLGPAFVPEKVGAGIILAGGAAKLPGMDEAAARIFGIAARRGENPSWVAPDLQATELSTVLGLLHYGLSYRPDAPVSGRRQSGFFRKVSRMFATA